MSDIKNFSQYFFRSLCCPLDRGVVNSYVIFARFSDDNKNGECERTHKTFHEHFFLYTIYSYSTKKKQQAKAFFVAPPRSLLIVYLTMRIAMLQLKRSDLHSICCWGLVGWEQSSCKWDEFVLANWSERGMMVSPTLTLLYDSASFLIGCLLKKK